MQVTLKRRMIRWTVMAAAVLLVVLAGVHKLREAGAAKARRQEWERQALRLGIPVYPERSIRLWLPVPRSVLPSRPETVVQVETQHDVENLTSPALAECPDGLVIMEMGISAEDRRLIEERFPRAEIVAYPNMPP